MGPIASDWRPADLHGIELVALVENNYGENGWLSTWRRTAKGIEVR
jgi:hypothetical protein